MLDKKASIVTEIPSINSFDDFSNGNGVNFSIWGRLAELTKALYLTIGMSLGTVPWFETRQKPI